MNVRRARLWNGLHYVNDVPKDGVRNIDVKEERKSVLRSCPIMFEVLSCGRSKAEHGCRRHRWARFARNVHGDHAALAVVHPNSDVIRTPTSRSRNGDMTSRNASQNAS
jgi:hypothetical protein